jgi:hypothetical protein
MRFHPFGRSPLALLAVLALAACNEEPDFGLDNWDAQVDTIALYSVDFAEYQGLPSAYDIKNTRTQRVEDPSASGQWDFALTGGGANGPLMLTPLGAFFDVEISAGLAVLADGVFDELENAPSSNSAYVTDEPVALESDVLYVARSRPSGGLCSGVQFAKIEPLEIDPAEGTFRFRVTANPRCNDTALIPPED